MSSVPLRKREPAQPDPMVVFPTLSSSGGGSALPSSTDRSPVELKGDAEAAIPDPPKPVSAYRRTEGRASIPDAPLPVVSVAELGPSPPAPETADGDRLKFVATRADVTLGLDRMRNALDEDTREDCELLRGQLLQCRSTLSELSRTAELRSVEAALFRLESADRG